MSRNINQKNIYKTLNIPPSKADIRVVGPLLNKSILNTKFLKTGFTSENLKPIDWRNKVSLSPIMNQQQCGDCWAMSTTSALADRFIIKKYIENLILEPAITAQCTPLTLENGCSGGSPYDAGLYFETNGIPSIDKKNREKCPSWDAVYDEKITNDMGSVELISCEKLLTECENATIYKAVPGSTQNLTVQNGTLTDTINSIKLALTDGPVVASFFVAADFNGPTLGYKWEATNGIYINGSYNNDLNKIASAEQKNALQINSISDWSAIIVENSQPAGHAVSIVGWGTGNAGSSYGQVDYWIVRNSWGSDWNENGFFRIAMNTDGSTNAQLGFDNPTFYQNKQFGGCISFEPDLSTGDPFGHKYSSSSSSSSSSHTILIIIIVGVVLILVLGLILYFLYKKRQDSIVSSFNIKTTDSRSLRTRT